MLCICHGCWLFSDCCTVFEILYLMLLSIFLFYFILLQNSKDNPPCNTLFIGNLPENINEEELWSLLSSWVSDWFNGTPSVHCFLWDLGFSVSVVKNPLLSCTFYLTGNLVSIKWRFLDRKGIPVSLLNSRLILQTPLPSMCVRTSKHISSILLNDCILTFSGCQ